MVRKSRPRSSSLFLMELILGILFFTIASAICVQIFIKSHLMSQEATVLNQAVSICSNAAEAFAATDTKLLFDGSSTDYYDQEFHPCKEDEAIYQLQVDLSTKRDREMIYANISMKQIVDNKVIYDLTTAKHIQRRVTR